MIFMKKFALLFLFLALAIAGCGKSFVAITVAPSSASLALGGTQQFSATVLFSDGSTSDVSTQATWTSSDENVATLDTSGLATGLASGLTFITANLGPLTSNTVVLSVANPLASIAITPANASVEVGQTQQFSATGTYQNGATADLTSAVAWASSDTNITTLDASGLASALAAGSSTISASLDSVSSNEATLQATALPTATLTASVSSLSLAPSGVIRTITLTNTSIQETATDVQVTALNFTSGTILSSTCASSLAPGESCQIFVTPGATASGLPGTAPTFGTASIQGSNTNALSIPVGVLTEGNIYQGGYIFSIDDSTPNTGSVGGKTVALADNSAGIQWYNGSNGNTGATSFTNGGSNTALIINFQGAGAYAAALCENYEIDSSGNTPCQSEDCYANWYLPAICELGPSGGAANCEPGVPNIVDNVFPYDPSLDGVTYWSSTQSGFNQAVLQLFNSGGSDVQSLGLKSAAYSVRCARSLIP